MKTINIKKFHKGLFCIGLINYLWTSCSLSMEMTDRNPLNAHAAGTIVRHYQDTVSVDTYRTAVGHKLELISLSAATGLGDNSNVLKATKKAARVAKEAESNPIEVKPPLLDSQTVYFGEKVGHVTFNIHAASFTLNNLAGGPKDYYHVILESLFYPAEEVISGKRRVLGICVGAEPTSIIETPAISTSPLLSHSLDKLSIIQTSPETTISKATYTSQVSLGFNLGMSVSVSGGGASGGSASATPTIGMSLTTQHSKSYEIADLNIRNNSGLAGRNVQWEFETANFAKNIHMTSPVSRSSLHAYTQFVWAVDYQAGTIPSTPLSNKNTERRLAFIPYAEVSLGKVKTKFLSKQMAAKKLPNIKLNGGKVVLIVNQTPLDYSTPLLAAPAVAPAAGLIGLMGLTTGLTDSGTINTPVTTPASYSLIVNNIQLSS